MAYLDISESSSVQCPSGLEVRNDPRSCRHIGYDAGCSPVIYQTNSISYPQIYGKVHACYSGSPDGFQYYGGHKNNLTLEDNYVEQYYQSLACNLNQLWDGGQCVGGATFYRQLPQPTTDNIEM